MEIRGIIWILCAFLVKGAICTQQFDIKPRNTEVNPGETAVLSCKIRNRQGECAWLKDGKVVGKISDKYFFEREPPNGDCSIHIIGAKLDEDDGFWHCQVTQTSLEESALTSKEVKFTVRAAPLPPKIEDNTHQIGPGESYKTQAGKSIRLQCTSRMGNPPALIKWFIDDLDITTHSVQNNHTEPDNKKTWQAVSILNYTFQKDNNGKLLRCLAYHATYEARYREIQIRLVVLYPPEITLEGRPTGDIEEGDRVTLRCLADANPTAKVIWRKSGTAGIYALKDQLDFQPIKRSDMGIYSCSATNEIGNTGILEVPLDVKYKPEILNVSPKNAAMVNLYNTTKLECQADGNPPPRYSWLQKEGGEPVAWRQRGNLPDLYIHNVTYRFQGRYICEADNVINGRLYKATSDEITLDVTGAPQVLPDNTKERVVVEKDEDATINIYFCSDPQPKRTFWEWGSLKLDTGNNIIRYIAEPLHRDNIQEDCYEARLIVQSVDGTDSRKYVLNVENDKGKETYAVALEVREPVAMSIVIGIVVGCVILLVIVVLVILYLLKAEKMCFNRNGGFKPDCESDGGSGRSGGDLVHNGRKGTAIPPDALYAAPKKNSNSNSDSSRYKNLKSDQNDNRNKESLVYADLDFQNRPERNGHTRNKTVNRPKHECIEYAEIQFMPKVTEQADI